MFLCSGATRAGLCVQSRGLRELPHNIAAQQTAAKGGRIKNNILENIQISRLVKGVDEMSRSSTSQYRTVINIKQVQGDV